MNERARELSIGYDHRGMTVPADMLEALHRYIYQGVEPGGFLAAIICNDLYEACGRADDENMRILPAYVAYLYNEAPSGCWGSVEKFEAWLARYEEARP